MNLANRNRDYPQEAISVAGRQGGFALVLVLWLLALLTLMAGGYSAAMRTESLQTANFLQSAQAGAIAEGGVWLAIRELQRPVSEQRWRWDNTPYDIDLFDGKVTLSIQNEAGKIDLNYALPGLLQGLLVFAAGGQTDQKGVEILQSILDWRDHDNITRDNGAEDKEYKAAGYSYGAKDGPFNSIDELRLVMGMTDTIYKKIAPVLTVNSHLPGFNPLFADQESLSAISGADQQAVKDYLSSRAGDASADNSEFFSSTGKQYFMDLDSNVFTITSTGVVSGTRSTIVAVILFTGIPTQPYKILSWRKT